MIPPQNNSINLHFITPPDACIQDRNFKCSLKVTLTLQHKSPKHNYKIPPQNNYLLLILWLIYTMKLIKKPVFKLRT